ncbi:MAG: hypothetical protein MUF18_04975 [Fimbriiglobus sp.]|nr:hypothetical protein [Fimbriiglobus sp.]
MRTTWKRTAVGLLIAGAVGGAALGLATPTNPPTFIPHADDSPELPVIPAADDMPGELVQAQAVEPAVRNDPAVALEWSGPAVVRANQPTDYTLTVRNVCGQSLQKVVVQVRAPKGVEIRQTNPVVKPTDGVYLWEFGTLEAKGTKSVTVTLAQPTRGDMTCQAWVTLTGTSAMKATVKEPKLDVTISAPPKVVVGDKIPVKFTLNNVGDHPAADVVLKLAGTEQPKLTRKELPPGGALQTLDEYTATTAGTLTYEAIATGADGLKSSAKTTVQVIAPKLDVSIAGPAERLIGRKGTYTVKVTNIGEVPLTGVAASSPLPVGFKLGDAGAGKLTADRLMWAVGDLAPGASKSFAFEGCTHTAGQVVHRVEAAGDRNTKAASECVTTIEGIPGLRMELVDSVDPVEKNGEVTYEIRVTNTGTKADSNVVIACELPKELEFVSASGPTKGELRSPVVAKVDPTKPGGRPSVLFDPIADLPPKTEAVFKVKVKGTGIGDVRFTATMTSKHLTAPVKKEESTRVYGE